MDGLRNGSGAMKTAVVGASGYAGGELVRILDGHPALDLQMLVAHRRAGQRLGDSHPNLSGGDRVLAPLDIDLLVEFDVVFLALPHGASAAPGAELRKAGVAVVDLGSDFRLDTSERYESAYGDPHPSPAELEHWVYGLPELFGKQLQAATAIAVPGCYPTAALLALAPLIEAGLIERPDVVVDAISGVTGAGRSTRESLLFGNIAEGVAAYGVGGHRHRPEMEMGAELLGQPVAVTFTPHLAPYQRGLLATVSVPATGSASDVTDALEARYASDPLVTVADRPPSTRWVAGSHRAAVWGTRDDRTGRAIVVSVIDNLGKGAAGQAVQALNVAMDWEPTTGLTVDGWLP